jgi:hypothetical protein
MPKSPKLPVTPRKATRTYGNFFPCQNPFGEKGTEDIHTVLYVSEGI